jgi:hypothetical protein
MNPFQETILSFNYLVYEQPQLFDPQTRTIVFAYVRRSIDEQSEWYQNHPEPNASATEKVANGIADWMFSDETHPLAKAFMEVPSEEIGTRAIATLKDDMSEQEMLEVWNALEKQAEALYQRLTSRNK